MLDEAEEILNAAGSSIRAEVEAEQAADEARHLQAPLRPQALTRPSTPPGSETCAGVLAGCTFQRKFRGGAAGSSNYPYARQENCREAAGTLLRVSAFTPDAVRELGGNWSDMRLAAVERFAAAPLPTPSEEIWRYSRIDRLDLDAFAPAACVTEVDAPRDAASLIVDAEPELFADETPDVFAELNRAFMSPVVIRVPAGMVVADADRRHAPHRGRRRCGVPSADHRCRRRQRGHRRRAFRRRRRRRTRPFARRARAAGPSSPGGPREVPRHQRGRHQHLADRQPAGGGRSRLLDAARHGHTRRRLRACTHRGPTVGQGRQHQAGGPVLRRRHPDARLPHHPGSRRTEHQQRPAVQGRRAGPCGERVHRA